MKRGVCVELVEKVLIWEWIVLLLTRVFAKICMLDSSLRLVSGKVGVVLSFFEHWSRS